MAVIIRLKELREKHPNTPSQRALGDYLGIAEGNYRKLELPAIQESLQLI